MQRLVNPIAERALIHTREIASRLPAPLISRLQGAAGRLVSRSPAALSLLYGSDKAENHYTSHYRAFLGPLRSQPLTLLEIGVLGGASLRMWRRYLPSATIVGIDSELEHRLPDLGLPGVEMHVGDQSDQAFLNSLISRYGGFDVVIDDGSHIGRHIRASFDMLYPAVRPGGWYVIEDLGTSYWEDFEGGPPGTAGTAVELVKGLVDHTQLWSGVHDAAELHLFPSIAFIRKAGPAPGVARLAQPTTRREPAGS